MLVAETPSETLQTDHKGGEHIFVQNVFGRYTVSQTVYLHLVPLIKMISSIVQAIEPLFLFFASIFTLPWTVWDRIKEIIRYTISLNGYTAVDPDGVLKTQSNKVNDDKDEGEEKEEGEEEG